MFRSKKTASDFVVELPRGTFLKTEAGYFYVMSLTSRYKFITKRVLDSWSPQRLVELPESHPSVTNLKVFSKMKFRDGSLLYSQANGKMYLVSDKKLRHIVSPDILTSLNLKRNEAVWVSEAEIKLHEEGAPLS